jgi:hypothetical protein
MEIGAKRAELCGFLENGVMRVNTLVDKLYERKQYLINTVFNYPIKAYLFGME